MNHKKVIRLTRKLDLQAKRKIKRKYSSYKGEIGRVADNIIKRDFHASKPNEKWYTDITEFNIKGEKAYLSPILDSFNQEIVSYSLSKSPDLKQTKEMLDLAFKRRKKLKGLVFHSDQGWQYQHQYFQKSLRDKKIVQSMSRKGNSIDNGLMECFFGILKNEMYYEQKEMYSNIDELMLAIHEYIHYYNNHRIKVKLKGLSPVHYRLQSAKVI